MTAPLALDARLIGFLDALRAAGKASTADAYLHALRRYSAWLTAERLDPINVTTEDLGRFQQFISTTYRTARGEPLAASTRSTISAVIKSLYRWMRRRGHCLHDPAARLAMPRVPKTLTVAKEFLTQSESVAVLETLTAAEEAAPIGSLARAIALRNLALVAFALFSGRRIVGIRQLRCDALSISDCDYRGEAEKGNYAAARVQPLAASSMAVIERYLAEARPRLLGDRASDLVFVSQRSGSLCHKAIEYILRITIAATIRRHPDLTELPEKARTLSPHGWRVSFALLAHQGGINLRCLQLLLGHSSPVATGRYLPQSLHDVRRAITAHPRW